MNLILRLGGFFNTNLRIWTSVVREELPCKQEAFAVAVMKDHMVVGHWRNRSITCILTWTR